MKSKNFLRLCAGTALVVSAFGAQAATVAFGNWSYGQGNAVHVGAPSYNGVGGAFNVTVTNSEIALPTTGFEALCVDLYQNISLNTTYNTPTYQVVSGASYFDSEKAKKLAKLFTFVAEGNLFAGTAQALKDDLSTAMQLAVWEIVYETGSTNNLSDGAFKETSSQPSSQATATKILNDNNTYYGANQLLGLSGGLTTWSQSIYVLKSSTNQDQIIWARVPEPASLLLAMVAFAAAGVATHRRKPGQA